MDILARKVQGSILLLLLTVIASVAAAAPKDENLVTHLPGLRSLKSKIYSGYITVDENQGRALFYYFAEAQKDSQSKPLTLWLNGGPGCSSLGVGAFSENGPFMMQKDDPIVNPHSWNQVSNMLYLESPAGVGFSYSNTTSNYYEANDENTALDSFNFLQRWVQKFPEYKNRNFYIAGESYAGRYIPTLAALLVKNKKNYALQLKGIMMGNPTIDIVVDAGPLATAFFFWTHGQLSDDTNEKLEKDCELLRSHDQMTPECRAILSYAFNNETGVIDYYNVLSDLCFDGGLPGRQTRLLKRLKTRAILSFTTDSAAAESQAPDPCGLGKLGTYLNKKDVQTALHVRHVNASRPWEICASNLDYSITFDKMQPLLKKLLENDVKVWIYSGDQDSVVPMIASRTIVNEFAKQLGWDINSGYRAWWVDGQVGGWTITYNTSLLYATVKGAGHMVPRDQPVRGFQLFKSFVEGASLPLIS